MRKAFLLGLGVLLLTACGFDPDEAREESEATLEAFLDEYESRDVVEDSLNAEDVISTVEDELDSYFTDHFFENLSHEIEEGLQVENGFRDEVYPFFLDPYYQDDSVIFLGGGSISVDQVDEEQETVILYISPDNDNYTESVNNPVFVQMIEEDGSWKINDVS